MAKAEFLGVGDKRGCVSLLRLLYRAWQTGQRFAGSPAAGKRGRPRQSREDQGKILTVKGAVTKGWTLGQELPFRIQV